MEKLKYYAIVYGFQAIILAALVGFMYEVTQTKPDSREIACEQDHGIWTHVGGIGVAKYNMECVK